MRQPLVLIPGIQGRSEYLRPAIDALGAEFDVIALELCGERGCVVDDASAPLDRYAGLVTAALDARSADRAIICGVSFGGIVALRFAATHPGRTLALILASTPGPGWHLRKRHEFYARAPWLFGPLFLAESPFRLRPEIASALAGSAWRRHVGWQLRTLVTTPVSPARMATRARLLAAADAAADAARISAPTLVITGEPRLDRVVAVDATREYLRLVPGAQAAVLDRTGHQGSITRPHEFARLVRDFVGTHAGGKDDVRASA